jgi:hypothetical protein
MVKALHTVSSGVIQPYLADLIFVPAFSYRLVQVAALVRLTNVGIPTTLLDLLRLKLHNLPGLQTGPEISYAYPALVFRPEK